VRTIAVIARKGGSGKTTVAVHLAIAAHLAGRETMVLDTDPQQSTLETLKRRQGPGPGGMPATPASLLQAQLQARTAGVDALFIDTPAGTEEGMSNAIVLCDMALLVVRPTFLDLAASVYTVDVLRRLRKPAMVVLNQAPAPRDGVEPPPVRRALQALKLMRLPAAPAILRSRASYQTALESGRSAAEVGPSGPAAKEVGELWSFIERFVFGGPKARPSPMRDASDLHRERAFVHD
jgi:chromosome partitioning protein